MVIWIIGLSGSGKTTLGQKIYNELKPAIPNLVFLDGDILRGVWNDQLGHTLEDRRKSSDRVAALCKLLDDQGIHVICSVLSIFQDARERNRKDFSSYYEIFLDVPLSILKKRDSKSLYSKAIAGEIQNVVGIDIKFMPPANSDIVLKNNVESDMENNLKTLMPILLNKLRDNG